MRKPYPFYQLTYDHLQARLDNPDKRTYTDMRNLFYQLREQFFRETGKKELRKVKDIFANWEWMVNLWMKKKAKELYSDEDFWVRVRDDINIQAHGRAICYTQEGDEYLVTKKRRRHIENTCSFILMCEKLKVGTDVFNALKKAGYKVNYISLGGYAPGDVQDAILSAFPDDTEGFYVMMLHDYDIHGVEILAKVHELSDKILDIGINEKFLEFNEIEHANVDEPFKTKRKKFNVLSEYVDNCGRTTKYSLPYLTESGRRVEIDVIDVRYGTKPFIDYAQHIIETECPEWDLGRIHGMPELDEPDNPFEEMINEFKSKVIDEYYQKQEELLANRKKIVEAVELETTMGQELYSLIEKHIPRIWPDQEDRRHPYIKDLETGYYDHINKRYLEYFDDVINDLQADFHHYTGDVRQGIDEIRKKRDEIQEKVDDAAIDDPALDDLAIDLDCVDYGQKNLENIKPIPLKTHIMSVIDTLYKMLEE